MFVSGKKEIWKIFYTLECVWVHMKIRLNWKYISVGHKLRPLDLEMILNSDFTFNQYPLSSLTHAKPKELGREIPKVKLVPTCLLSLICLLSLSLWPTKARSDTACHWSCAFTQEPHLLFHSHLRHSRFGSVSPSLRSIPQATPLHSGLLSLISLFLCNLNQTPPPPTYFFFLISDFVVVVVGFVWVMVGFVWVMVDFLWVLVAT